jgi:hypothetical protein
MKTISVKLMGGLLFALLLVANFVELSTPPSAAQNEFDMATLVPTPKFKRGTKTYDSTHKWIGCVEGDPKNCLMVVTSDKLTIDVSFEGVLLETTGD